MDYHEEFMRTQGIASGYAQMFNDELDGIPNFFKPGDADVTAKYPRVSFLDPLVVEVKTPERAHRYLIEEYLPGNYTKYNSNLGYVEKECVMLTGGDGVQNNLFFVDELEAIEEGSKGSESDEEGEVNVSEVLFNSEANVEPLGTRFYLDQVEDSYIPQVFSHYTYQRSRKRLMVVDLQGVLTTSGDGTKLYKFTDPVIHKHRKRQTFRKMKFGRTDRGEKGMRAFFETHVCTELCRLLGLHPIYNS